MCRGERIARNEMEAQWVVVTLMKNTESEYEIVHANRTQVLNWWGFGITLFVMIPKEDYRSLLQAIEYGEKHLNMVIEERPLCATSVVLGVT